jgi:glycosyltransferase involved in cell wall biosynthesis
VVPIRVLCVLDSLAPGGTERSTIVTAPLLREIGVHPTIATLQSTEDDLGSVAESNGTPVVRLAATSFAGRVRELRRLVRSGGFDLVHTALFNADQLGRVAAWGTGVPVISSFVSTPYDETRLADPNVVRWKLRAVQFVDALTAHLMVDCFHAVSWGAKVSNARALRLSPHRVIVAERGRDGLTLGVRTDERRASIRAALGVRSSEEVVLNLGRQDHQKGQTLLIAAASILSQTHPELRVLIAGKQGSASTEIESMLVEDPMAAGHVQVLGHRTDVGDLLCAADALVIASHFEGTAGVALEAMALATPIVSTDLAGLHGVLQNDHNAILVPAGDPVQLAGGIGRVLEQPDLARDLAAQGRRDFVDRFTVTAAAQRLRDLYETALAADR